MLLNRLALITLTLCLVCCPARAVRGGGNATAPTAADRPTEIMRDIIERHGTDLAALRRYYHIPISPARTERLRRFFDEQIRLLRSVPFDALDQSGRIDYVLFENKLRFELRQLNHDEQRAEDVASLIPFAGAIVGLEEAQRRMEPIDSAQSAQVVSAVARDVETMRKDLEERLNAKETSNRRLPNKVKANRAAGIVDDLRASLKRWHEFYTGYHPEFTWWATESFQAADRELNEYATLLRRNIVGSPENADDPPIIGDPIGREALLDALNAEMIPYTPEELIEMANQEFAWCEAEYCKASRELGYGDDWRRAFDHVSTKYVPAGEQPALIKILAQEAVDFLNQHELVTIPDLCREIWRMEMMSPERQRVNPFFTGGEVISVSYPTSSMSYEDKRMIMRGNNQHFSRATVQHELIPGHHLQTFMAQRYRPYRQMFRTPFLVEGWALYWEMLLWDRNFPKSPEDRIGFLFWRSHRCARIIFSLKFHLGQMTPQECIDLLVDRVGHERRNATGEVRRSFAGNYAPLYQAAYMVGGLQLRSLHKELVQSGRLTDREFHDAVLKENAIPIAMIRASLARQPLTRDDTPHWRFYDFAAP